MTFSNIWLPEALQTFSEQLWPCRLFSKQSPDFKKGVEKNHGHRTRRKWFRQKAPDQGRFSWILEKFKKFQNLESETAQWLFPAFGFQRHYFSELWPCHLFSKHSLDFKKCVEKRILTIGCVADNLNKNFWSLPFFMNLQKFQKKIKFGVWLFRIFCFQRP